MVKINQCLNAQVKFFGLPIFSLVLGAASFLVALLFVSGFFAIGAAGIGVVLGVKIAKIWYEATIQKFCYWHWPFGSAKGPQSWERRLV